MLIRVILQAALQMTPSQKRHARDLHSYYWNRMRDIMSERHRLSLAMLVCKHGLLTHLRTCLNMKLPRCVESVGCPDV
jgi:hypothetical protein